MADGSLVSLPYRWVLFIDRSRGDESAVGVLNVLYPGINWGSIWVKKMEDEPSYSVCVDEKARSEGQRRVFGLPHAQDTRSDCVGSARSVKLS